MDTTLENYPGDKWNSPFSGKCQDANYVLVWTKLKERPLCVHDSDKWLPKKIGQCLPVPATGKPVLPAVKPLASFLSVSSDRSFSYAGSSCDFTLLVCLQFWYSTNDGIDKCLFSKPDRKGLEDCRTKVGGFLRVVCLERWMGAGCYSSIWQLCFPNPPRHLPFGNIGCCHWWSSTWFAQSDSKRQDSGQLNRVACLEKTFGQLPWFRKLTNGKSLMSSVRILQLPRARLVCKV